MNDSSQSPEEFSPAGKAGDRFVDAALRSLAEGELETDKALEQIEGQLDAIDRESSPDSSVPRAIDSDRSRGRGWLLAGGGLAAAAGVVFLAMENSFWQEQWRGDAVAYASVEMAEMPLEEFVALPEPAEPQPDDRLDPDANQSMIVSTQSSNASSPSTSSLPETAPVIVSPDPVVVDAAGSAPERPITEVIEEWAKESGETQSTTLLAGTAGATISETTVAFAPPSAQPTPSPEGSSPVTITSGLTATVGPGVSPGFSREKKRNGGGTLTLESEEQARQLFSVVDGVVGGGRIEGAEKAALDGLSVGSGSTAPDASGRFGRDSSAAPRKAPLNAFFGMVVPESDAAALGRTRGAMVAPSGGTAGERYGELIDNRFASPLDEPLSTFSVDVDTASYTNLRRMIQSGAAVPPDAIRIEEMINYFSYDYPQPDGEHPFAFAIETAASPWNADHQLLRVGIQGKDVDRRKRPHANLVFLLDVSGSMNSDDKLPLVKQSMSLLVEELTENDCVSIVVYAGAEGLALPATRGSEHALILRSLDRLKSGGSTNGGAGIQLAYQVAAENYIEDGINRVILCTDGDFNVGKVEDGDLAKMVQRKAKGGVFLSVLGFGTGNINDSMMEKITNEGNGTYYYVDSLREARKVFLQDLMATLVTIAKDVKIQVEFNPAQVQSYRLIGYANRMLEAEDFENDKVDAGEVGAGHAVTALYEIVPVGVKLKPGDLAHPNRSPELRYQREKRPPMEIVDNGELATVKLRYKQPDSDTSTPMEAPVVASDRKWKKASNDFQFSAAVALFGLGLRGGEYAGEGTLEDVIEMAKEGMGADAFGRRQEFLELVKAMRKTPLDGRFRE